MALIDEQGRVFGRMNVVDVLVGAALVIAIPVGYAAYLLWRAPVPELTEVLPATLVQGPNAQVEIHGQHFRPYMRLSFGDHQGTAFYFVSPTVAVVPLPPLPPGTYDLILYDYSREVARLPRALTLQPPPPPRTATLEVEGAFIELADNLIPQIKPGLAFSGDGAAVVRRVNAAVPAVARIASGPGATITLPVSRGLDVPATLSLACRLDISAAGEQRCLVGDTDVAKGAVITVLGFGVTVRFRVDELRVPGGQ